MSSKTTRGEIAKTILACVGAIGIAFIGAAMPGIFKIIPLINQKEYPKKALDQSIRNLMRKKLLKFSQTPRGWRLQLTERGQSLLYELEVGQKFLKPRGKWDKKWRLLIFDIEEKRKNIRNQIRKALISFGFYRLQDSVWAYPYECEEILELLRTKYNVRHEALYARTEYLAKDRWLKQHFGLN